jgi:hypothetical protein
MQETFHDVHEHEDSDSGEGEDGVSDHDLELWILFYTPMNPPKPPDSMEPASVMSKKTSASCP